MSYERQDSKVNAREEGDAQTSTSLRRPSLPIAPQLKTGTNEGQTNLQMYLLLHPLHGQKEESKAK